MRAALLSLLDDKAPEVRAAVREEIRRRPPGEGPVLVREIRALRSRRARLAGFRAVLDRAEDPTPFLDDPDPELRARAVATGRASLPQLQRALDDRDGRVCAIALETLGDRDAARERLRDAREPVRIAAARVIESPPALSRLVADRSWRVRLAAIRRIEERRVRAALPALIELVDGEAGRVRARAIEVLERATGAPFGDDAARWREWWGQQGPAFEWVAPKAKKHPERTRATIRFRRIPVVSRRLTFVLDASRSMNKPAPGQDGATRWQLVVRDLAAVLERLPRGSRFNVVLFRTDVEAWKRRLVPASKTARRACRDWVERAPPGGWTNLFDAVRLALRDDAVDTLYVLTDGVPSRGAERTRRGILAELRFLNRYRLVEINCVQAGGKEGLSKSWQGFLEDLAQAHDGIAVRE